MGSVRVKLKVLTPLFMGGADPEGQPELRAASIRGAMRFWFRAIAGSITSDPREVYKLESEVFGNTEKKSKVAVRVKATNSEIIEKGSPVPKIQFENKIEYAPKLNFLAYLANMGLAEFDKQKKGFLWARPGFEPGTLFKVEIICPQAEIHDIVSLTLQIAVQFGGFGARWRHGFGSCEIQQEPQKSWSATLNEVIAKLTSFAGKIGIKREIDSNEGPAFSSFRNGYYEIVENKVSIKEILTFIGLKYREFRIKEGGYKKFGYTRDYLTLIRSHRSGKEDLLNDIFGLPIQFGKGKEANVIDKKKEIGRRASPLILHVEPNSGTIRATIFKSQPLPEYESTKYQAKFNGTIELSSLTFDDFERVKEFISFLFHKEDKNA